MPRYWAPAWLAVLLILIAAGGAKAQAGMEETRVFGAWSLEVSQHTQEIITLMEAVNEGLDIATQFEEGTLDQTAALAQFNAWRALTEQQLSAYAARADRLSRGPAAMPEGTADAANGMAESTLQSVRTARDYYSIVDVFVRDTINGLSPDPNLTVIAQFSVIQIFYEGVADTNRRAIQSVLANHPQHHLLTAIVANTEALILVFEEVRQSYGGMPSQFAVDDVAAEITRLNQIAVGSLGTATMTHRVLTSQIEALSAAQLGLSPTARQALLDMMATYPDSIAVEGESAALMLTGPENANAAQNFKAWDAWLAQIVEYEGRRDALQFDRQRLVSQM